MHLNTENPHVGAEFQGQVKKWFCEQYHKNFELDKKIAIGSSDVKKEHKFDVVAEDNSIAIECKCYTWTETGNVPSAKIGFLNEAAFYLSFLPDMYEKYIVMLHSTHDKRNETLAEYYYKTNKHLIGNVKVAEYDPETNCFSIVGRCPVVTLCGSTRFKNEFIETQKRLTLEGNIVISVGLFGHSGDNEVWDGMNDGALSKTKEMLDDMHKQKIDMADSIYVINPGGYIGESTKSEIAYAIEHGKRVDYLERPDNP